MLMPMFMSDFKKDVSEVQQVLALRLITEKPRQKTEKICNLFCKPLKSTQQY